MASNDMEYTPNGGQTAFPPTSNTNVSRVRWNPTPRPIPPLPPLELRSKWIQEGWQITADLQHELHGVTPIMIDWFWANMEKCYFLWAPGDHKWFEWIVPPSRGFIGSSHNAAEQMVPGGPLMFSGGVSNERKDMSWYPFTTALGHVIVEYLKTDDMAVIHQWEAADYGTLHRIGAIARGDFLKKMAKRTDHSDYEEARWCEFLPSLYELWKDHPDPTQNVHCDLRVKKLPDGEWVYISEK